MLLSGFRTLRSLGRSLSFEELRETVHIIGDEHVEERAVFLQTETRILTLKPRPLFSRSLRHVVRQAALIPRLDFGERVRSILRIDPLHDLIITVTFRYKLLECIAGDVLPAKKRGIDRAVKAVFTDVAPEERAALVDRTREDNHTTKLQLR